MNQKDSALVKEARSHALEILHNQGDAAARTFVTDFTNSRLNAVAEGYWDLVDYLLFTYYFRSSWKAPQNLPSIRLPRLEP